MQSRFLKIGFLLLLGAVIAVGVAQAPPTRSVAAAPLPITTPEPPAPVEDTTSGSAPEPFHAADARLNDQPWASAAIYCTDDGIQVLGIDAQGNGYLAFTVSQSRIERLGVSPTANIRLGAAAGDFGDISLWRLSSGAFQLHAPGLPPETSKPYDFIFQGCP
jgi:hypothetical protein